jgi:tRNA G18 (ribose-2'-O)-methylase SpoU
MRDIGPTAKASFSSRPRACYHFGMIEAMNPNPLLAARDKELTQRGLFLAEGSHLVRRALAAGLIPQRIFCLASKADEWRAQIPGGVELVALPEAGLSEEIGYRFHRGVFGLFPRPQLPRFGASAAIDVAVSPDSFAATDATLPEPTKILVLHDVADPENLGALIRTASSLGLSSLVLSGGCPDPYGRKALRASMGAAFSLPLRLWDGPALGLLECLEKQGIRSVAASPRGNLCLGRDAPPAPPLALILGNEGFGLADEVIDAAALSVSIPMSGRTDSLNVAAAGAILMWELFGSNQVG